MAGKLPDYYLMAKYQGVENRDSTKCGAAWLDEASGRIRIKLGPAIVLNSDMDFMLTLFPNTKKSNPDNEERQYGDPDQQ